MHSPTARWLALLLAITLLSVTSVNHAAPAAQALGCNDAVGVNVTVTLSNSVAAGDAVVLGISKIGSNIPPSNVTDAAGNTYTQILSQQFSGFDDTLWVYLADDVSSLSSGQTITATTNTSHEMDVCALAVSGVKAAPLDQSVSATGNGTNPDSGSAATTQADEILVGVNFWFSDNTTSDAAPGSGFTEKQQISNSGVGHIQVQTLNVTSTGSYASTATLSGVDGAGFPVDWSAAMVTLEAGAPEINLVGNGTSIADGDTTPSTTDDTDFGSHTAGGSNLTRTFTIENTGSADLDLTGSPNVAISGSADFSIASQPGSDPVPASGSTTFDVQLDPTNTGTQTATISIANDDSDENPYTFDVSASISASNSVPSIGGTSSGQAVTDKSTIDPFSSVTLGDSDGDNISVIVTLDTAAKGVLTNLGSFTDDGGGQYSLASTAPGTAESAIRALTFDPTENRVAVGNTETTTFAIAVSDGTDTSNDSNTSVVSTSVNDAPTLLAATPNLTATDEDTTSTGDAISTVLGTNLSDVDPGASEGIAITATTGNGTWQFSTDGGISFVNVGSVAGNNALLLGSSHIVRYVPDGDNGETATIDFLGWDQTSGSAGNKVDASTTGGTTAFSTISDTASITVSDVNDEPTLTASGSNPTYTEGDLAADLFNTVSASTVDTGQSFSNLTLTVTNVLDGADEILRFDDSDVGLTDGNSVITAVNGLTVGVSLSGDTASVSFAGATLGEAAMQTLVDGLAYRNDSDDPSTGSSRAVTITEIVDSGSSNNTSSLSLSSTVSLTAVNDPPVVGGVFGETSQVVAGAGLLNVTEFDDGTVSNPDSLDYDGGSLTVSQTGGTLNGSWGVDGTTATSGGDGAIAAGETIAVGGVAIGTVDVTNDGQAGNALEIFFNTANATSARIESLIRAFTYSAPSGLGTRTFELMLDDGDGTANGGDANTTGNFSIEVTPNAPVVSNLDGDSVNAANNTPVLVDAGSNAGVSDADSADFDGGNVTVSRNSALSGNFSFDTATVTSGGDGVIAGAETVFVGGTAIGTVSSDGQGANGLVIDFNASATPGRTETLIRALQFAGIDGGTHSFELTVTDAGSSPATSSPAAFSVVVNTVPTNTVPGSPVAISDGAQTPVGGLSVADPDSASLTSTVSVPSGGIFNASGSGTVSGDGTSSIQLSGTVTQVNDSLGTLSFTAPVNSDGDITATLSTTDGMDSDVDTFTLRVTDDTAPAMLSITRLSPGTDTTNADTLMFRVRFDGDVVNLDASDFAVTGGSTASITGVVIASADSIFDLSVSGGDLAGFNGIVGLDLAAGQDIADPNGNALPTSEPATDETYTLDNTAPTLISIERQFPADENTNADSLTFRASFDGDVENVDAGDFTVNGTTMATVSAIAPVTADRVFDVTVSGGDLANFDGTVGLDLAAGQDIADAVGNALPAGEPAIDDTYTLDNTVSTLISIERQTPVDESTNADSLTFRVTFDGDVENVDAGDFTVNGTTTATVSAIAPVTADSVFDVTVSGGDLANFDGTVGLDLAAGQDIADAAGNALPAGEPATDETYTLDNSGPELSSIVRQDPMDEATNVDALTFRATFNSDVENVDASDLVVTGSTATISSVTTVTVDTVFDLTVSGGDLADLDGTVGLDLAVGQDIADAAGNALPTSEPATDEIYTLDNTAPTLISIERQTPADENTNADSLTFRVSFDGDVEDVDAGDFTVNGTTTATVSAIAPVTADRVFDVTVSGGDLADFDGTVGLDLAAGQDIADAAGNPLPTSEPSTDETYTLGNTGPELSSILRQDPMDEATNVDTLTFRATFDSDVENVDASDFVVTGSTATITSVTTVTADTVFDLIVSGGDLADLNGTVGLDLAAGQDIADAAGNALPTSEPATDETYTVDNTKPSVSVDTLVTTDTTPPLSGTVDDDDAALELTVDGQTAAPTNNGDGTWTLTDDTLAPLDHATYDVSVTATDEAGNEGSDDTADELRVTTDTDGDGVDDSVEAGAPNDGDGNNDGIPDREQPGVTSLPTATDQGFMTLVVDASCGQARQVVAVDSPALPADPVGSSFAFGLVEFQLPCESATLEIIYHDADADELTGSTYRKYGPTTPGDPSTTAWYDFSDFAMLTGNVYTLDLSDNRLGDDTGNDGLIVDVGGPATRGFTNLPRPIPVNQPWALVLLILASLALGVSRAARRAP